MPAVAGGALATLVALPQTPANSLEALSELFGSSSRVAFVALIDFFYVFIVLSSFKSLVLFSWSLFGSIWSAQMHPPTLQKS